MPREIKGLAAGGPELIYMSHNTFGHLFRVTTWGESHGPALGCVVDGCPPGIRFTLSEIQHWMDKRKPGQSSFVTQRREDDIVKVLSGVMPDPDGETLITWTSNIVPWITHGVFEHSRQMQTVEIFSPRRNPAGELAGIEHEIVFYDPEALVEPLRLIQVHIKTGDIETVDPYIYARCIQTIYPIEGRPQPLRSPGLPAVRDDLIPRRRPKMACPCCSRK